MACGAGIGYTQLRGDMRTGNTELMIAPGIHAHVSSCWHVTIDTTGACTLGMEMVSLGIVFISRVTLHANAISRNAQFQAVRFMAVATGYASLIHLALHE